MSDYWKDFISAMRTTRIGDCTDSDPELAAAWLGWQARDANIAEYEEDSKRLDWVMRNVSGSEWRKIGVIYPGNCDRDAIDAAIDSNVPGNK